MKNLNKILALALSAGAMLSVQSCSEDYLEVDQYEVLSANYMVSSDENFEDGILSCYANMNQLINEDSMKPWLWFSGHPTMDTQATGWDKSWLTQSWAADQGEMYDEWKRLYDGISLCNSIIYMAEGNPASLSPKIIKHAMAEARALRGFYYLLAAQTWANIPILSPGQSFTELSDNGGEAGNAVQVLDTIISDLTFAAANLEYTPRNGQYGRVTKGMAQAFLAEAYLWKEYRQGNPSGPGEGVQKAKDVLKEIIDSKTYALQESFTTLFDPLAWNKESIWEEVMDEGDASGQWKAAHTNAHGWTDNYASNPNGNTGWGTLYLSWEFYTCFEQGDKRRDGSACIPEIKEWGDYKDMITDEPLSVSAKSKYCYGVNPYLDSIWDGKGDGNVRQYHCNTGGDRAPNVFSVKWWRTGINDWWNNIYHPVHVYWKRYADVLLTYAECCFRTGNAAEGWEYINQVRKRAFGDLEDGKESQLNEKYSAYYKQLAANNLVGKGLAKYDFSNYPIPFGSNMDKYVDGETYYAAVKQKLGFSCEVWQVAMIQERRKEFNCEWVLAPALHREGLLGEHLEHNYPASHNVPIPQLDKYPWSNKTFDYSEAKMDFPIPAQELIRNPKLTQNKAYR